MIYLKKNSRLITYLLVGIATCIFAFRLFHLIDKQAVNILFFDQWDFLTPLFENPSLLEMFTKQHGPHRQGLGLFISKAIGEMSSWNTRAESFGIGIILLLSTIGALVLKKRLFGNINGWDVLIPAIILSPTQLEAVVLTPNPAHGALPLLLVIAGCLALTLTNPYLKYILLLSIGFLATYTGFGFFFGLITSFIFFGFVFFHWIQGKKNLCKISAISLIIYIVLFASFFIGYHFSPAQECFEFLGNTGFEYILFISLELAFFIGFYTLENPLLAKTAGLSLLFALVFTLFLQIYKIGKEKKFLVKEVVIVSLILFSLLFALNSALGRACAGLSAAQTSRYMPLLIPGFLSLYFAFQKISKNYTISLANLLLITLFVVLPAISFAKFNNVMKNFSHVKKAWATCYIQLESIENCNQKVGNVIYPAPEATNLKSKLNFLKEKNYNLFSKDEQ